MTAEILSDVFTPLLLNSPPPGYNRKENYNDGAKYQSDVSNKLDNLKSTQKVVKVEKKDKEKKSLPSWKR